MSAVSIQSITTQHPAYQQVWNLREEVLRKPLGLSLKDEDLSGEVDEIILVAFDGDTLTGSIQMRTLGDGVVKFRQMAVLADRQKSGIGSQLMRAAEALAWQEGYLEIEFHARLTAVPFYEKLGYQTEGEPFEEVGIPHLLMTKTRPA